MASNGQLDYSLKELLVTNLGREIEYNVQGEFNFARKANFLFDAADTDVVVLLNDDTEVISVDWLWALVDYITRSEVGAVGGKL